MKKYNEFPIVDLHTDYVLACYEQGKQFKSDRQINLDLLKKANYKLLFCGFSYDDLLKDTEIQFAVLQNQLRLHKDFSLIKTKQDLSNLFKPSNHKIGMIWHMEGADILKNDERKLIEYYKNGLRSIGLTHSSRNCLAAGNKDNPEIPLTKFGEKIVKLAHKLHIVVDLAHLNEKGFYKVLDLSVGRPVIVSHANTYKYCPDQRNLKDHQIRAVAKAGGVIGPFFSAKYVRNDGKQVTIDDVVKHIVHIVEIGGIDVLALGSDFGGITTGLPTGLENASKLIKLFSLLKRKGFSQSDLEKICYKNAIRILSKILA